MHEAVGAEHAGAGTAGRYSPETPPHAYSPVTLSYSSCAAAHGAAGAGATAQVEAAAAAMQEAAAAAEHESCDTAGRYSPETPLHAYLPVTLSYSSDAEAHGAADIEAAPAEPGGLAAAEDEARAVVVAMSADPAAADEIGGAPGEDAATGYARGRTGVRMCEPGHRAGSAGADSRQATSRMRKKRRVQDDELEEHMHQEKLKELEQTVTTEELHCQQRRYHQQKGVVPARSRDG